jgi:homoserine dehydrogenase
VPRELYVLQFGLGWVGSTLVEQILQQRTFFKERFNLTIHFIALMRRQGGIYRAEGFTPEEMKRALEAKRQNKPITLEPNSMPMMAGRDLLGFVSPENFSGPLALIDATGADELGRVIVAALRKGINVVTANKRPFAASFSEYQELIAAQEDSQARLMHETTVGGGLPILRALRGLVYTGDAIEAIQGCLSGTNGFICSELEQGRSLTDVVREAQAKGYTEADPRQDLAGWDAARKAIILARTMGLKIELNQVEMQGFVPAETTPYIPEKFEAQIRSLDVTLAEKIDQAKQDKKVPRFLAQVSSSGCRVGLAFVEGESPVGRLSGPENIVVFKTMRYHKNPLIIQGPGAGPEVTAAGVLRDLLSIAGIHTDS